MPVQVRERTERIKQFRETTDLDKSERESLDRLKRFLERRRRELRAAFPDMWQAYADRAGGKRLRKQLGVR